MIRKRKKINKHPCVTYIDIKARDYIEPLLVNSTLQKRISNIRRKHSIPVGGFNSLLFDQMVIEETNPRIPPTVKNPKILSETIINILKEYGFSIDWLDYFHDYLLFNYVGDLSTERQINLRDIGCKNKSSDEILYSKDDALDLNPVALLIPPSANQTDIINFVVENWRVIEHIQKLYGKEEMYLTTSYIKNDYIKKRDRYIYKRRFLPKKELVGRVADKFGKILEYTHISKIIQKEEKKRKAGI